MKLAFPPVVNTNPPRLPAPDFVLPPSFDDHFKTPDLVDSPGAPVVPVHPVDPVARVVPDIWRPPLTTPPRPLTAPPGIKFKAPKASKHYDDAMDTDDSSEGGEAAENDESGEDEDDNARKGNRIPVMPEPSSLSSPSLKIIARRGPSGDTGKVQLKGGKWITNYEYNALRKRTENKMLMENFDLPAAVRGVIGPLQPPKAPQPAAHHRDRIRPQPRVQPGRVSKSQPKS